MAYEIYSASRNKWIFNVEGYDFMIDTSDLHYIGGIFMRTIIEKPDGRFTNYIAWFTEDLTKVYWDWNIIDKYCIGDINRNDILGKSGKNDDRVVTVEDGHFLIGNFGIEDPHVRTTIEELVTNNRQNILETIELIRAEGLLE